MSCPQCQQSNPVGARFCNHCGARLAVPCQACHRSNPPGSRFCSDCGESLAATTAAARPVASIPPHLAERILTSRGAMEGERKRVTVVLADLKGSMELLADRDPEEARKLLDPVLEGMIEAVHHYEGTVNQVMGDGIMALFGAPLAHEDHALRACYAALRMQERLGRYGDEVQRRHGVPIQIRVGLNSGDVVVRSIGSDLHMDYTAVGQTTHLAARMEQMTKPGSILLTSATLRLVEGHAHVRALGAVPVKGMAEPIDVFELLGAASGRTRLQVAATRGLTRFTGRDAELDVLRTALEHAGRGQGQVVAVVGEPGVGKSRLIWELAHSHRMEGWLVLQASGIAYGKMTPLLPIRELLTTYFGIDATDDARRIREKLTGKLLTLDSRLGAALPAFEALFDLPGDADWKALEPDVQRRRLRDAVKQVLLRESSAQPVLLALDDLHWIDTDTQTLLDSLVESLPGHRVLLLVNYRPEYTHAWGGKTYYSQVRLDPLPAETAETLLEALLGDDPSLSLLTRVLIERSQGNPFFLEESVRALAETGTLVGEPGAYRLSGAMPIVQVPDTVQAILAARIDRLSPEDKHVLQVASVVGVEVPLGLLQDIADRPADAMDAGLARLRAHEFIYETRLFPEVEYTFKHTLTHDVAYASLLQDHRRALHARVVEAIERLYPTRQLEYRDRLVHHAFRGEVWAKAVGYLRNVDAVASPEEIGEVMGGPESPGQLWWVGEHERALRAAERDLAVATSFGDFRGHIAAMCRLGQTHHTLGNLARAAEFFGEVITALDGDVRNDRLGMAALPAVWARSWLAWTLAEQGRFDAALEIGLEGAGLAEAHRHDYSRIQASFGLGKVYLLQARAERAIAVLEPGLVLARVAAIPFMVPFIAGPLGAAYALDGRIDAALAMLEQTIEQSRSIRLRPHDGLRLVWLGDAHRLAGRRDAAAQAVVSALQAVERSGERAHAAHAYRLLGDIAAGNGRDSGATAAYTRALEQAEALGMQPLAARCRQALERPPASE